MRFAPFLVALALIGLPTPAATALTGVPSCPGGGICTISVANQPLNQLLIAGQPFGVDIVLEDHLHLELIDNDTDPETIAFSLQLQNDADVDINVVVDFGFSDEFGNILVPPGTIAPLTSFDVPANSTVGSFNTELFMEGFLPLIFHDVHVTFTADEDIHLLDIPEVAFRGLDDASNVGVWVPEPGSASLLLLGGAGLLLAGRRRV
jgi:hypothetical protein